MSQNNFKIAFFEIEPWEKDYLLKNLKNCEIQFIDDHLNQNNTTQAKDADAIGVFIYSEVNKKILEGLPKLKLIATLSTGFEHIDLKECKKRKIAAEFEKDFPNEISTKEINRYLKMKKK